MNRIIDGISFFCQKVLSSYVINSIVHAFIHSYWEIGQLSLRDLQLNGNQIIHWKNFRFARKSGTAVSGGQEKIQNASLTTGLLLIPSGSSVEVEYPRRARWRRIARPYHRVTT